MVKRQLLLSIFDSLTHFFLTVIPTNFLVVVFDGDEPPVALFFSKHDNTYYLIISKSSYTVFSLT